MKSIVLFGILILTGLPPSTLALPNEEKERTCKELSRSVLPVQRETAVKRCLEFADNECDRIERSLNETCLDTSHSDNAIKYDLERGGAGACEAAVIKRDTQKIFCDGLRKECFDSKVMMGGGGAFASCSNFRNEDFKKLCAEVEHHAKRIIAAETAERQKCAPFLKNHSKSDGLLE